MLKVYFILISVLSIASTVFSFKKPSPLSGNNMLVIPMLAPIESRVNDSAQLREHMPRTARMQMDVLIWLARRHNFTFSICQSNDTLLEKPNKNDAKTKGAISFLLDRTCDMVIGDFLMTVSRFRIIDMPFPWVSPLYFLIPASYASENIGAILKPFQMPVWILLVISVITVIIALKGLSYYILSKKSIYEQSTKIGAVREWDISYLYVVGIFLYQGGPCISKRLAIRFVVGVWCLVALVLGLAYNSTLITYVIAHNEQPLMRNVNDVVKNPNIQVLLEEGWGLDVLFSTSTDKDGIVKILRDRINSYPNSRCKLQEDCVKRVRSGGPYVSPKGIEYILDIILKDFQETKECRLQVSKEGFMNFLISFALAKGSLYTDSFSEGMMEMNAFGLIDHWIVSNYANPHQCLKGRDGRKQINSRLSFKNMTGAFALLLFGWGISLLIFLVEQLNIKCVYTRRS